MVKKMVQFSGANHEGRIVDKGRVFWDGQRVTVEPKSQLMQSVLTDPLKVLVDGKPRRLTPADGELFLANLRKQYRSAYFGASDMEDAVGDSEDTGGSLFGQDAPNTETRERNSDG